MMKGVTRPADIEASEPGRPATGGPPSIRVDGKGRKTKGLHGNTNPERLRTAYDALSPIHQLDQLGSRLIVADWNVAVGFLGIIPKRTTDRKFDVLLSHFNVNRDTCNAVHKFNHNRRHPQFFSHKTKRPE
ncbi:hypothetical protein ACN9M1_09835 [Ralstonia sp. R-29]|uniref:hypothetical protein n=1 Tax=Ralstonia sp. R-29 TaxID=3404059 RepID=UPI003CF452BA